MFSQSQVQPENTDATAKKPSKRPNIRITGNDAPVIIEAEFDPANNVENEAQKRLKSRLKNQSRPVESIIALIYPKTLRQASNLKTVLAKTRLRCRVFYANNDRFPERGRLEGFVHDLANLIHLVSAPRSVFDRAANPLTAGINSAVSVHLTDPIFSLPGLANVPQTRHIACASSFKNVLREFTTTPLP